MGAGATNAQPLLSVGALAAAYRRRCRPLSPVEVTEVFRGKIVDIGAKHVMIEISGPENKIEAFIELMRPYGIREMVRTGRVALMRGGDGANRRRQKSADEEQ